MARKAIKKSIRFEVFKRDSFTCQYCGAKAPEAILVIDHVNPVAGGGDNDILNLVTSCQSCNAGKGAKKLSDKSAIVKQQKQLEELNARREQLEMLIQWRQGLTKLNEDALDAIDDHIQSISGYRLNDYGRGNLAKWVKKFGVADILESIDESFTQYADKGEDGRTTNESFNKAYNMVPRIAGVRRGMEQKPYLRDLFYIRGICRNRMYVNERYILEMLETAIKAGASVEDLKDLAKTERNWTGFQDAVHEITRSLREGE